MSFGDNSFTNPVDRGFVPPPLQYGEYIFGIHVLGTRGNAVMVFDKWFDSREAPSGIDPSAVEVHARSILVGVPDDDYIRAVSEEPDDVVALERSEPHNINWYEISAEAL